MNNTELIIIMLAEASTKDISVAVNLKDFEESKKLQGKRQCCQSSNERTRSQNR